MPSFNALDGGFTINSSFNSPAIFSDYLYTQKEVFIGRALPLDGFLIKRWIIYKL